MNSLYILTKQEFTSLYRFGELPVNLNNVIKIEGLPHLDQENLVFNKFKSLPFFIGDEEYLIVRFETNRLILIDVTAILGIKNINEIIPLTESAKHSLKNKFDPRLCFKTARFESIIHKLEDQRNIKEMKNGADTFSLLCKSNSSGVNIFTDAEIAKIYGFRESGKKSSEILEDFLIHLMVYDRHEYFPKTDLGYFYDVGELFAHSEKLPTFKGSQFYKFLEEIKDELGVKDILEVSEYIVNSNSDLVEKFKHKLTSEDIKKYILAAIFLKFKEDMSNRDTIKGSDTGKLIGKIKKSEFFQKELDSAIYMIGLFFGYEKFYDDLYDVNFLRVFNKIDNGKPTSTSINSESKEKRYTVTTEQEDKIVSEKDHEKYLFDDNLKNKITSLISESESKVIDVKLDVLKKLKRIFKEKNENTKTKNDIKKYIILNLSAYIHVEEKGNEFSLKIKGS